MVKAGCYKMGARGLPAGAISGFKKGNNLGCHANLGQQDHQQLSLLSIAWLKY